jgi:hypothetical protein
LGEVAQNVTTRTASGRFWQVEAAEEVELLLCGFAQPVEAALSGMSSVFLDAPEQVERGSGAGAVAGLRIST